MILACLIAVSACGAFDYHDGFDYPNGTEGAPAWFTETVSWEVHDGALVHSTADRAFAILEQSPHGQDVAVEATLTIRERQGEEWLVAGVAVRRDARNFWHVALAEAPASKGKQHFIELTEMLDGTWLSESAEGTRLQCVAQQGRDFDWQYGHPYRVKLHLTPERIEGAVTELDGTQRAHVAYMLDGRAVKSGQPAFNSGCCEAAFDDAQVNVAQEVAADPEKLESFPPYTVPGNAAATGEAKGFFYPKEVDGRAWLIDPNGQSFYMVGTDHASFYVHWCQKLGYAPYSRNVAQKFGDEAKWADSTAARLSDWHFNTLPANHSLALRHRQFSHIEFVSFGTSFSDVDGLCPKTTWTGFPDVFSPKWPRHCDKFARQHCAPVKGDPWLIGYFLDNELEWFGKNYRPWGLFDEAWKKAADNPAKQAWVEFLKKELEGPKEFEANWGVAVADFDALAQHIEPAAPRTKRAEEIALRWVRLVADAYFKGCADAVRKHDPNHLILGCRFAGNAPDIWDIAGKYCDVVSFNIYPRIDVEAGVPQPVIDQIQEWHAKAQRPMMVTEWSFPALDAGLPSEHGAGMRVDTQEQRARCFSFFQTLMFSLPFMVGSDYFMWADEPAQGISESFPEDSNYGLVDLNDEPYAALTNAARDVNGRVYELHTKAEPKAAQTGGTDGELVSWLRDVPAGTVTDGPSRMELRTGTLALAGPEGGDAWVVSGGGVTLGRFRAMMHEESPEPRWAISDTAKITGVAENAEVTVVEMELDRLNTEQDPFARRFRSGWRFWISRGDRGWFATQCLWVENADALAWRLTEVFHYIQPAIGGDPVNDEPLTHSVPNYYRQGSGWVDTQLGKGIGCWYAREDALVCNYWKGPAGDIHSDLRQKAEHELTPGQRVNIEDARAIFFPLDEISLSGFGKAVDRIAAHVGAGAH